MKRRGDEPCLWYVPYHEAGIWEQTAGEMFAPPASYVEAMNTPAKEHMTRMNVTSPVIDVRIDRSLSEVERLAHRMSPGSGACRVVQGEKHDRT